MAVETKRGICFMCWQGCELEHTIVDGKLVCSKGDPNGLYGGFDCERVKAIPEFHYHPDRLNYPLKRKGERGGGQWERISWDRALDEIAEKLMRIREQYGSEAVTLMGGTVHEPADWSQWRFANYWGTANIYCQGRNCGSPFILNEVCMYGWDSLGAAPVPGVTKTIVCWGANPVHSWVTKWNKMESAQERGAKLVVVDPRYTETASKADLWLQIRPGTDSYLGWALIKIIIEEGLYDHEFVEEWCLDFDKLAEKASKYDLDEVSKMTDIPVRDIVEFAHWYADGPTCAIWPVGPGQTGGDASFPASYTQQALRAITGNVDREGGNPLTGPHWYIDYFNLNGYQYMMDNTEIRDTVSADRFPLVSLKSFRRANECIKKAWYGSGYGASQYFLYPSSKALVDAMIDGEPYPIKALFIQGGNPLVNVCNSKRWYKAMKESLDLVVGMDWWMTPSLALCDYVLPAADFLERPHLMVFEGVTDSTMAYRQPLPALHERKDDYYLWQGLAKRCDLPGEWPDTYEEIADLYLGKGGVTYKELSESDQYWLIPPDHFENYKTYGFGTPSGKVELAPTLFVEAGLDPMPDAAESPQGPNTTPDLAREYPFRLNAGYRMRPWFHSQHRQLKSLRWQRPYPLVEIHPEVARSLDITDGNMVWIETPLGRIRQQARITEGIRPDTVAVEAYWYFPEMPQEDPYLFGVWDTNVNAIITDDYETCNFAGDNAYKGLMCKIYKAGDGLNTDEAYTPTWSVMDE